MFNYETGLSLMLKEGTLTPTGATFILKNSGKFVIYYGQMYFLQTKLNEKWVNIEGNPFWTLELISLNPGGKTELNIDWSLFFGELPPGNYRFVKEFRVSNFREGKRIFLCYPFTIGGSSSL